ncbi:hypothetical protein WMY93_033124 [Mugilogobius chulae]|uniref:Uncharacterized protein n=1 Tax=Mugilogobius chulae TaxID=88201 RepID=A0AAW0MNR9_9GOBI
MVKVRTQAAVHGVFPAGVFPLRRRTFDPPSQTPLRPHRRGHQLGRGHVLPENQPAPVLLLHVSPRCPGRRPGGEARQTQPGPVPGLRLQVLPAGSSAQGENERF